MKKRLPAFILSCLCCIVLSSCEEEPSPEQIQFEQEMEELNEKIEDGKEGIQRLNDSIKESSDAIDSIGTEDYESPDVTSSETENLGLSVDDFVTSLTSALSKTGISPIETKDMNSIYFLYFNSNSGKGNIKLTERGNMVTSITIDRDLFDFDIIFENCIAILDPQIDAGDIVNELNSAGVESENGLTFSMTDTTIIIMKEHE